ncbi:SMEK domain-containing protein [Pseudomonas marginalis]|uniref:SMEK domain-containing protein n=1 Tax=Pseudomonas marginalis TaxID=298 RepID=UPI0034D416E1
MDHQKLLLEVKDEFIWLVKNVEASTAMGLFDVHRISEKVVLPLFQTIMGWPDLRNLNEEKEDYPAIDLGDEVKQIGIQISGTTTLTKVKNTLAKFLNHDLDKTYTRVIVYVLTNKQQSYFQKAIDEVVGSRLAFNAKTDILDYTDLLKTPRTVPFGCSGLKSPKRKSRRSLPAGCFSPNVRFRCWGVAVTWTYWRTSWKARRHSVGGRCVVPRELARRAWPMNLSSSTKITGIAASPTRKTYRPSSNFNNCNAPLCWCSIMRHGTLKRSRHC